MKVFVVAAMLLGILKLSMASWSVGAELAPNDGPTDAWFGYSVSLSTDGHTALIGAPYNTQHPGAAYVFVSDGSGWTQQAKLVVDAGASKTYVGWAVAINGNGNVVVLGDTGFNGFQGAAYVFARNDDTWVQQGNLTAIDGTASDQFGWSVAISSDGKIAAIGAPPHTGGPGATYVFAYNSTSGAWTQQAKLVPSGGPQDGTMGTSVALSSNGSVVLSGASSNSEERGAAYVFAFNVTAWTQQAKLIAADGAPFDEFGYSVALDSNATYAVIGAPGAGNWQGAAYVFVRNGESWSQQAKLAASDGVQGDKFGWCVTITSDGTQAFIAANHNENGRGAVYVFARGGTSTWIQAAKLAQGTMLGWSVSTSSDGSQALVGTGNDNNEQISYVFYKTS